MKPVAFDYERPVKLDDATKLLAEEGIFSKAIAGSQSLGPMLNLRLAQPDLLVDITAISELREYSESRDHLDIGACITHADIEDGRLPDTSKGLLRHVAGQIAYRAVRNRGTVGGSIAHADPAADWISVFSLLGAEAAVWTHRGGRNVAVEDLILSSFTTVLRSDELIRAIRVPKLSGRAGWGYCKFNRKVGEFAHAIAGIVHDPERGRFRVVIGAIETAPIVVADATTLFGGAFGSDLADRVDEKAVLRLLDVKGVTDEYSRRLLLVGLKRAARQASMP
jgi:carbon-monoxide dehydrogenase medium subunit